MINAEVVKTGNENNVNLIRRFTKKVQGSGVLPRVRSIRYASRKMSEYVKRKNNDYPNLNYIGNHFDLYIIDLANKIIRLR